MWTALIYSAVTEAADTCLKKFSETNETALRWEKWSSLELSTCFEGKKTWQGDLVIGESDL